MMAVPSCDLRNFLLTHRAESVLLFPKVEQPVFPFQGVRYVNVEAFFIVVVSPVCNLLYLVLEPTYN